MLYPSGWFEPGHDRDGEDMNVYGVCIPRFKAGKFVLSPAPAVNIIMIEKLRKDRQKRTKSAHVLGVLRLLWNKWRRHI